jgi:asparagine synthase (glutamine-hydrolysing)
MCGIAGIVDLRGRPVDPKLLKDMTDAIHHRGPDDEGYVLIDGRAARHAAYCGPASPEDLRLSKPTIESAPAMEGFSIGLAHRRFSIIDLSSAGHQPFFSQDGSCCVVFNGEIYNYIELREELEALGVTFRSRSDTEVLLEAYRAWGAECFSRFNGFWAIALYDFVSKRLILSRDRLGKKPIYWARVDDKLYFASEMKSLLRVRAVAAGRRVNEAAVWHWCVDGRRDLNNETFFANIRSLPAASWTVVDYDFPAKVRTFWEVPRQRLTEDKISVREAMNLVRDTLEDAVRLRLRADVPLAIELSGGLDSSSVLALAARHHPGRLTTYTVKFPEPQWDEEPYARSIASRYNVDYRVIEPELGGFWRSIGAFTHLQEEPYHSPNMQTSQVIWSKMRVDGTKVVLTGAAGDEMFAGYARYYWKAQTENLLKGRWKQLVANASNWTERQHSLVPIMKELIGGLGMRPLVRWLKQRFPALENQAIKNLPVPPQRYAATLSDWLYEEITNTQIPYWLRSGEKTYMGIPFEARLPFLDYRVVEIATRLPTTYLIRDGWHKWILRKAMEDVLPPDVVWRPVKMGFPYPYERFFANYRDVIDTIIAGARNPYVDFNKKHMLRTNWNMLSFILWYEYFINNNHGLFGQIERTVGKREPANEPAYTPVFKTTAGRAARGITGLAAIAPAAGTGTSFVRSLECALADLFPQVESAMSMATILIL